MMVRVGLGVEGGVKDEMEEKICVIWVRRFRWERQGGAAEQD